MRAIKSERSFASGLPENGTNGGESSGTLNRAQVAKPTPDFDGVTTIFSQKSLGETVMSWRFCNKHDENHKPEKRAQGKSRRKGIARTS